MRADGVVASFAACERFAELAVVASPWRLHRSCQSAKPECQTRLFQARLCQARLRDCRARRSLWGRARGGSSRYFCHTGVLATGDPRWDPPLGRPCQAPRGGWHKLIQLLPVAWRGAQQRKLQARRVRSARAPLVSNGDPGDPAGVSSPCSSLPTVYCWRPFHPRSRAARRPAH
jgi:hypothetical protein